MINRVVLVGRLVRDPELKKPSGTSICNFDLAVDTWQKDAEGNRTALYIRVVSFNQTAENVSKFARKGSLVGVDGRLSQRKFERKDGTKGSVIEVIADQVRFLEPKSAGGNQNEVAEPGFDQTPIEESKNLDTVDLPDDDLPWMT